MPYYTSNISNPYIQPRITNVNSNKDIYSLDVLATYTKFDLLNNDTFNVSNYTILKKYEKLLKYNSVSYELSEEEKYRPELVSNNIYGTPNLWYLILFLNDIERACKFTKDSIIVLPATKISLLSQIYSVEKEQIDNKDNPMEGNDLTLYTSRYANVPKYKLKKRYKAITSNKNQSDESLNINKNVTSRLLNYNNILRADYSLFNYKENVKGKAIYNNEVKEIADINEIINTHIPVKNANLNSNTLLFNTISKKDEIISFKPCSIGKVILTLENQIVIDKTYTLPEFNNSKVINDDHISVNDYSDLTSSLIFEIIPKTIANETLEIESIVKYERKEISNRTKIKSENSSKFYHYVNIDDIYGTIQEIKIYIRNEQNNLIQITSFAYNIMIFDTFNIAVSENDIISAKLQWSSEKTKLSTLLISKNFKNYRNLLSSDIIYLNETHESLEIVNSNDSRSYIDAVSDNINSDTVFKGSNFFVLRFDESLKDVNDFSIYCLLGADSFKYNGSLGIFFKYNKEEKVSYLYTITKKYGNKEENVCYLSGLYKLYDNNSDRKNIKCDSEGYNVLAAELLSTNVNHYITGTNNDLTSLKIITEKNNIKIYGNETNVLINYTDPMPIQKPKDGYINGIYIFNLANPIYRELTIHELKYTY